MKKNKVLSMLLVLSMTLGLAACGNSKNSGSTEGTEAAASSSSSSESEISMPSGYDDTSKEVYDAALGDFYEAYQKVDDASSLSERYALDALAEAKLLEAAVWVQVQKVVHTISAVLMRKVNQTYYGEMIMRDSIMCS